MSKIIDNENVTSELLKKVEEVISDFKKHKFSVSKIYSAHNEIFVVTDRPQSCPSCLSRRAAKIKAWFADYEKWIAEKPEPKPTPAPDDSTASTSIEPIEPVKTPEPAPESAPLDKIKSIETIVLIDGSTLSFIPDNGKPGKGTTTTTAPGTYEAKDGRIIAVQVGGRVTLKPAKISK
jgi:hypothetical protein